jgi:transcriptional regulator with XRE-family HTH domain
MSPISQAVTRLSYVARTPATTGLEVCHMAKRDPETDPRARLGDELRRARAAAGFSSQEALAAKLGFDRTVIAKAETGDRPPTPEVLAAWCQACGIDAEFFERWAVVARRADGPVPTWFEDWLKAEGEAQSLRLWSPLLIPGLLQTAEYARALFLGEHRYIPGRDRRAGGGEAGATGHLGPDRSA